MRVRTVCALCRTVDDEPRPAPSNPVLAIATAVAGSYSSFLARLNRAKKPTGRTAEARSPMGSRREGSLPRQNWVSVNSAGAVPSLPILPSCLAPWSAGPVLQVLLLPGTLVPQTLLSDFDQGTQFSFLCRTDETGLCRTLAAFPSSISSRATHLQQHVVASPDRQRQTQSPDQSGSRTTARGRWAAQRHHAVSNL